MTGYQVIGHYTSLAAEYCTSCTLSDGKVFLDLTAAQEFARANMHPGYTIKRHENITHYWDPERGQFYHIKKKEWI